MKDKFSCEKDYECIIPIGLSPQEIEKRQLPHSCLECEYYTMETREGKIITICEWRKNHEFPG